MLKKVVVVALALLFGAQSAYADSCSAPLTGVFTSFQANKLCASFGAGTTNFSLPNNVFLKAASASGTPAADNLIKADGLDNVHISTKSGGTINLDVAVTPEVKISDDTITYTGNTGVVAAPTAVQVNIGATPAAELSFQNDALFFSVVAAGSPIIGTSSVDAADSNQLCISSAPACTGSGTRGGYITIAGNEHADAGSIRLQSGNVANDVISLYAPHSSGKVTLGTNNSNDWEFARVSGATVLRNATGGGDVSLALTGTTLAIQEATAGSACSGTLTANGSTPVVTSTTCALTGSRIFLQRTSAETGVVEAWISAISTGVSFSITGEAGDTGTYNWIIFHEAP